MSSGCPAAPGVRPARRRPSVGPPTIVEKCMSAYRTRIHLGLEHIEDRCTPSAVLCDFSAHFQVLRGALEAPTAHVRVARAHEVPIKLTAQCFRDIGSF